jgi:predicted phosphohydrolase
MKIWAIADLHLSFGVPNKKMDIFGSQWENHDEKIQKNWDNLVSVEDLVLIPGDVSWAMRLERALPDLEWIHKRPGKKVLIRGNHDYWWDSLSKLQKVLPASIQVIQNNSLLFNDVSISGARLWDSTEYSFDENIEFIPMERPPKGHEERSSEEIFVRELGRLELSLKAMAPTAKVKIAITHFPPIGPDLKPTRASALFEKYGVSHVVFGHLHSLKKTERQLFGKARGVEYILASADWINFCPMQIMIDT